MNKQHIESNCVIRDDTHDWGGDTAAPITESVVVTGEVGTGYFDKVTTTIESDASTQALKGSTEEEQF